MPTRTITLPIQGMDDRDSVAIDDPFCTNLRNVRSLRERITTAPGGTLLVPTPTPTGILSKAVVGTIQSPIVTGAVVYSHTLGVAPKGYIFTGTHDVPIDDNRNASASFSTFMGLSDGTDNGARSHASENGDNPATAWVIYDNVSIIVISPAGVVKLKGSVTASSTTTFTVTWATVDTYAYTIGYTLIGGASVSCKLKEWQTPIATGNKAVAGVGFTPQAVINLDGGVTKSSVVQAAGLQWGVMTTTTQWAVSAENSNVSPGSLTNAQRDLQTDRMLLNVDSAPPAATTIEAAYVSMDVDGFTVHFYKTIVSARYEAALCIAGFTGIVAGSFAKVTSPIPGPASQSVTGVGASPTALLFTTVARSDEGPVVNDSLMCGMADGAAQFVWHEHATDGILATSALEAERTDSCINYFTGVEVFGVLEWARAELTSLDSDGFTLNWVQMDDKARIVAYLAFAGSTDALGVIRNYSDLIVGGTPAEKFVMLTSKTAWLYTVATSSTGTWASTGEVYTGTDVQRFSIANTLALAAWSQGKNNIRKYTGAAFSGLIASGTNHAARTLLSFNNRIISVRPLVAAVDQKTQIRWCVNGDPTDWAGLGSGTLEVVETSQQALTGGVVLGERCYLTRAREVVELIATGTLSPVFRTETRVPGVGAIATHSIATGDIYAFWLGPDEIYMWDGGRLEAVGERMYETITQYVDYENLDQIQGTVYEPDSQYHLVVPPYRFVYDYRRKIWDWDDTRNFEAIGRMQVQDLFTADIDHSEFTVMGDSFVQTIRDDPSVATYLGAPIDAYFETKDFLPLGRAGQEYQVSYDKYNSVWRVWFRGTPAEVVEVGISIDKGLTYPYVYLSTVNAAGVGIAFFDLSWGVLRIRLRSQSGSVFSIQGPMQLEFQESGQMLPP